MLVCKLHIWPACMKFNSKLQRVSALWQGLSVEAIAALRSIQADSVQGASAGSASALVHLSYNSPDTHMIVPSWQICASGSTERAYLRHNLTPEPLQGMSPRPSLLAGPMRGTAWASGRRRWRLLRWLRATRWLWQACGPDQGQG